MVINSKSLLNCPVLSLHIEGETARTNSIIVDPDNLKIMAFGVSGPLTGRDGTGDILMTSSVRELNLRVGMIINSADEFVSRGEVVKLDKVLDLNFSLIGLNVVTKKGTKLGKVIDFTVSEDFTVLQLIVKRPLMKALMDPELVISRKEIVAVDDYTVTVRDEEAKLMKQAVSPDDFVPNFVNPFREGNLEPSHKETLDAKDTE
ncbi:MAG: PRC-barrel domain-containing protein [Candidatus Saccharibacteria bacterium]|nr:PRC-barrel domain-containing protein [Candidatus Saccharibacteria bacterium]